MPQPGDWKAFATLEGHIRLILLVDWDPIGVFGIPEAMDEYDSYVKTVIAKLQRGATVADISHLLAGLARTEMGMPLPGDTETAAAKIIDVYRNGEDF